MIKFIKTKDVKTPERGHNTSSGIDFFVPNDIKEVQVTPTNYFLNVNRQVYQCTLQVFPGEGLLIPSGIKTIIPPGFDLVFENKSGIAVKQGLIIGASVVDSEYRGEIHLHLINTGTQIQEIKLGQKLAQGIVRQVELCFLEEITEEEYNNNATERASGGFGSTGI